MRTLLYITHAYPPQEGIASLRASRMVEHLDGLGYRSLVLCGKVLHGLGTDPSLHDHARQTLHVGFPDPAVLFSPLRRMAAPRAGGTRSRETAGGAGLLKQLKQNILPLNITRMPDRRLPWIPGAIRAVIRSGVKPDAVFSSSSPPACAMLGAWFSRRFRVPWIAEFRDLWSHNPVERLWRPLARLDEMLEKKVLAGADRLATVSDELVLSLEALHHKPVLLLPNGHDWHEPPARKARTTGDGALHILHGGSLYRGRRDPFILLDAIRAVSDEGIAVRATFVGHDASDTVDGPARELGVADRVTCLPPVPHGEFLDRMQSADVLAVIEETVPAAAGNATGKLFEYVGTRKPVLAIAPPGGAIDRTLRRTGQGRAVTTSAQMIGEIRRLKDLAGFSPVEKEVRALSRRAIAARLAAALDELLPADGDHHD